MSDVPGFPLGLGTPSAAKLAARLAEALPDADRERGLLLAQRIFERAPGGSRKAVQRAYDEVAEALRSAGPADRVARLRELAAVEEIRRAGRVALSLAVARYLADRPDASVPAGSAWLNDDAQAWRERGPAAIAAEADRRLAELDEWRRDVDGTEVWETRRVEHNHIELTLQSARSGSFASAAGPLTDFLRDMGESVDELEIH